IRKFLVNSNPKNQGLRLLSKTLTIPELRSGERDLLYQVQLAGQEDTKKSKGLNTWKGEDGLVRVKTRLTNLKDIESFKSPILLPSHHPIVQQLIHFVHETHCHAGTQFTLNKLRERYWIVQGRKTIGNAIRKCIKCKRFSAKNMEVEPSALPDYRIKLQSMFQTTGVD